MRKSKEPIKLTGAIEIRQRKQKEELFRVLAQTPIIQTACAKTGVARATFYRWRQDDPEFSKNVDKAMFEGSLLINDMAESQLIAAVRDRNLTAITYWLKHHHDAYKTKIEIEGRIDSTYELSKEQENLVKRALRLANLNVNRYAKKNK